jgi:predicted DCC family thiol-disulfide oxidoreductase YuxK
MTRYLDAIDGFFFARRSAWPFGLMRAAWAGVALFFLARQWVDVTAYYSDAGFLPRDLVYLVTREDWIFSVLSYNGEAWYAWTWYLLTLLAFACSALGIAPRTSTILSYLLLTSFHERNAMTLGGGDTVLRNVGFILAISPGIHAFSFHRLRLQYAEWRKHRKFLPKATMPAWPYRLLLWQLMVIYITSLWWKLLGDMWVDGTAVGASLHHLVFIRWPYEAINYLMPFAAYTDHATLAWEASWLLLLVPAFLWRRIPGIGQLPIKRLVMAGGVAFHGSIAILMDVGCFPFAVGAAYLGLLDETDRAWLKHILDRRQVHPIAVLYDGSCRLCRRSAFALGMMDAFHHLKLVDFRDAEAKKKTAPHLHESQLDLAMHVLLPDQSVRTGFDAFRFMAWHLPTLWLAAPFLYVPGISHLGRRIYAWVAKNREKCTHDRC